MQLQELMQLQERFWMHPRRLRLLQELMQLLQERLHVAEELLGLPEVVELPFMSAVPEGSNKQKMQK